MESLAESLEFEAMLYQWIYIILLIYAVICIIYNLNKRSNLTAEMERQKAIETQYQQLLDKYNATAVMYAIYETGVEGVPKDTLACIFINSDSIGFCLIDNEFDKTVKLDIDKLNWWCPLSDYQTIDIDLSLPKLESVSRLLFSYKDSLTNSDKYIVFHNDISKYKSAEDLNYYDFPNGHGVADIFFACLIKYGGSNYPKHLIHNIIEEDTNTINL